MTTFAFGADGWAWKPAWRETFTRYAILEYGTRDIDWLLPGPPRRRQDGGGFRGRIRDGLLRLLGRRPEQAARTLDEPAATAGSRARADPATCPHADLVYLGAGGRARYYRCGPCGSLFVVHDERVWTVRRSPTKS